MRLLEELADVAMPETMPRQEGNQMHTILSAKRGAAPKKPVTRTDDEPEQRDEEES